MADDKTVFIKFEKHVLVCTPLPAAPDFDIRSLVSEMNAADLPVSSALCTKEAVLACAEYLSEQRRVNVLVWQRTLVYTVYTHKLSNEM
jgi:hypothetical protein